MEQISYLIGDTSVEKKSFNQFNTGMLIPYSDLVCDFLDSLSKKIMKCDKAKMYQDVVSLGFWCRKANILKMKERYLKTDFRIGRGLAFHIAPSNVPINTFYSLFLGLLAGCKNIVRTSTKEFPQIELVADYINELLITEYVSLKDFICVVRYDRKSKWTQYFSSKCLVRIIWGGDDTIKEIGHEIVNPRCKELKFADRYSIALIDINEVDKSDAIKMKKLAHDFYNDTYLNDQNACSSPHLILWYRSGFESNIQEVKKKFWDAVYAESLKYNLEEIKSTEKYTALCDEVMHFNRVKSVDRYENRLYVCELSEIPDDVETLRGKFGLFYEYEISNIREILNKLTVKTQTCLYFGDICKKVTESIYFDGLSCIDRIVPVGKSLDISEIWDGYNMINEMTRIIKCE